MLNLRRIIRSLTPMAILAALAIVAVSCSLVEEKPVPVEEPVEEHNWFQIRFQICTRNIEASRADDSDEIKEECGSIAENIINLKDIHYYLFDKEGDFLTDLTPGIDNDRTLAIDNDYSIYEVVAKIDHNDTDYFWKNRNGTVDFYIMAFANYSRSSGYTDVTLPPFTSGTPSALFQMFQSPYTPVIDKLPDTEKLMKAATDADAGTRNYFPMAGLQRFKLSGTWFETMPADIPVDISAITHKDLNMLRAMAKLEVIDRINMKPDAKFEDVDAKKTLRIQSVDIKGAMTKARILPNVLQWNKSTFETQQVTLPSIVDDSYNPETTLRFEYDAVETQKRTDHCPVYSCYIWEYQNPNNQDNTEGNAAISLPTLVVTVHNPAAATADALMPDLEVPESLTFNLLLTDDMSPEAKDPKPQESFLRNYIYRYEISGAVDKISIKWSVCPMDKATAELEFN